MTAIASIYTQSGFILAADGRQRWGHKPTRNSAVAQKETDCAQKIFRAKSRDIELGYVIVGDAANLERSFDFAAELRSQVKALRRARFSNCRDYVSTLMMNLEPIVERLKRSGELDVYPETYLHFAGYFNTNPCVIDVDFHRYHGRSGLLHDLNCSEDLAPGRCFVRGSLLVGHLINAGNPMLARYTKPLSQNMSLTEASAFAKGYIEACSSTLAMEIDPEIDWKIGGHIHIASLTPTNGFQWVVPPKRTSFFSSVFGS